MSLRNSPIPRIVPLEVEKIDLTQVETSVCDLLDGCANSLTEKGIPTTCRIAGGWVRDKVNPRYIVAIYTTAFSLTQLLGSQSNDIDVALSGIMGLAFAEHLAAFAQSKGVDIGSITAIEQNPEQSKHLETATFKIFGLNIDLVNLRSEAYAQSSRIPTEVVSTPCCLKSGRVIYILLFPKSFGTPCQDALRRDITINALFYNVHTREVEDFTEKVVNFLF